MLTYSAMIVVARRKADVSMAPATCLAQVLVFAVFAPAAHVSEMGGSNLGYLALLGIEYPSAATVAGGVIVIGAVVLQVTQGGGVPGRVERPADDLLV